MFHRDWLLSRSHFFGSAPGGQVIGIMQHAFPPHSGVGPSRVLYTPQLQRPICEKARLVAKGAGGEVGASNTGARDMPWTESSIATIAPVPAPAPAPVPPLPSPSLPPAASASVESRPARSASVLYMSTSSILTVVRTPTALVFHGTLMISGMCVASSVLVFFDHSFNSPSCQPVHTQESGWSDGEYQCV